MKKERATVWVTKYALTDGLELADGELHHFESGRSCFLYKSRWCTPNQWHKTKEEAIARAEEMRKKKNCIAEKTVRKT